MDGKKQRRRVNWIDILLVVLVLAVAGAAYVVVHGHGGGEESRLRTYVVELSNLEPGMEQYVSVGDRVTDNVRNYELGTVTAIEVIHATESVLDEDALVVRQVPVEDRYMMLLTIEVETVEDEDSIDTLSNYTLREGAPIYCTAGQLTGGGYILYLER